MAPCAETTGGGGSNPAPNGCSVSECANLHGARLPPPKLQECCNSYTPRTRRIRNFSSSLVTRTLHRVPSSTPRSLPFDRFVAAYNSYHCAPPFQVLTRVHRGCGSVPIHHMPRNQDQFLSSQGSHSSLEREIPFGIFYYLPLRAASHACELPN